MDAKGQPPSLQRPVAECPPLGLVQKQVQFDLANDLGDAPSLPMDLANFLGENATDEQIDAPPNCSLNYRSPTAATWQLPPALSHPYGRSPTKTSTAKLVATIQTKPLPKRMPDCTNDWIQVQMNRMHGILIGGKSLKLCTGLLSKNPSSAHALQFAQWQTAAFRLPLAQEEASGCRKSHAFLADCIIGTSYPELIPLAWWTFRLLHKKRNPGTGLSSVTLYREVGDTSPESSTMQHRTFKGIWHPWCS